MYFLASVVIDKTIIGHYFNQFSVNEHKTEINDVNRKFKNNQNIWKDGPVTL